MFWISWFSIRYLIPNRFFSLITHRSIVANLPAQWLLRRQTPIPQKWWNHSIEFGYCTTYEIFWFPKYKSWMLYRLECFISNCNPFQGRETPEWLRILIIWNTRETDTKPNVKYYMAKVGLCVCAYFRNKSNHYSILRLIRPNRLISSGLYWRMAQNLLRNWREMCLWNRWYKLSWLPNSNPNFG